VVRAIAQFPFISLPGKSLALASLLFGTQVACAVPTPESFPSSPTVALQSDAAAKATYQPVAVDEFISSRNLTAVAPREVALQLFSEYAAESEGRKSEEVKIEYPTWDTAVVRVTVVGLADDSVGGVRYRIAFERKEGEWKMTEVGRQFQCQENRGHQDWSAELCS